MTDVFWVEDSPEIVDLLSIALQSEGEQYALAVATTYADGLADLRARLAEGRPPDVVLLDIRLPDGDGLDLFNEVADALAATTTRALVLSSSDHPRDVTRSEAAGLEHLVKPLDFAGWQRIARRLVGTAA